MSVNKPSGKTPLVENIGAELGRRGMSRADLAPILKLSKDSIYRRMRGELPFNTDEVETLAAHFGVPIHSLFAKRQFEVAA